jgi:tetratricopeptide (TPR) repeat protein
MMCRAVGFVVSTFVLSMLAPAQDFPRLPNSGTPVDPRHQMMAPSRYSNSVTGFVRGADNRPLGNVHVELRDANGGIVGSVATGNGGDFEFRQIAQGIYHVIAMAGVEQAEERVEVNSWTTTVNLRLPGSKPPNDDSRSTISVAQYRVPERAREELRKAREASMKGKTSEAQNHVARALEIYPKYADALTMRAILKLAARNAEGAVQDLEQAIQCDGSYAMAYLVLGSAFNSEAKFDDAIRALQRGETLSPDAWQAYFEMGKAYLGKTDYPAALHELNRAQTLAPPDYPLIRLIRAHVLMQLDRYAEAVTDLQTYLEKNPEGADAELAQKMLDEAKASLAAHK